MKETKFTLADLERIFEDLKGDLTLMEWYDKQAIDSHLFDKFLEEIKQRILKIWK